MFSHLEGVERNDRVEQKQQNYCRIILNPISHKLSAGISLNFRTQNPRQSKNLRDLKGLGYKGSLSVLLPFLHSGSEPDLNREVMFFLGSGPSLPGRGCASAARLEAQLLADCAGSDGIQLYRNESAAVVAAAGSQMHSGSCPVPTQRKRPVKGLVR